MCETEEEKDRQIEITKMQFEYALEHFKHHAQQRTTVFNFFIVALGITFGGVAALIERGMFGGAGVVSISAAVIVFGFLCLDFRNKHLVKYSEDVLEYLEETVLFKGEKYKGVTLGIMLREDREKNTPAERRQWMFRHGLWIPTIQGLAFLGFLATAAITHFAPAWVSGGNSAPAAEETQKRSGQSGEQQDTAKP